MDIWIFLFFLVVKVIVLAILYIANILLRREVESLKWCRRYSCISPALLGFLCLFVKSLICQQGIVKFKQEMTEKGMMKNASIRFLNILLQLPRLDTNILNMKDENFLFFKILHYIVFERNFRYMWDVRRIELCHFDIYEPKFCKISDQIAKCNLYNYMSEMS